MNDLKDKIKKAPSGQIDGAPLRQNGADRGNFLQPNGRNYNTNRSVPKSINYQQEAEELTELSPIVSNENFQQEETIAQMFEEEGTKDVQQNYFIPSSMEPESNNPIDDFSDFFSSKKDENDTFDVNDFSFDTLKNDASVSDTNPVATPETSYQPSVDKSQSLSIEEDFLNFANLFIERYPIEKLLISNDKVMAVNFLDDTENDNEIFDEEINTKVIDTFISHYVKSGFYETTLNNNYKLELLSQPVANSPTIVISKINTDLPIDDEITNILFEFLNKNKNIAILSSTHSETLFSFVSDFRKKDFSVTINEPVFTFNNLAFFENKAMPSLKTVFSITNKIEPDSVIIYKPTDIASCLDFMKQNSRVVLFSDTEKPSDFINSDILRSLNGFSDYNKAVVSRSIDIIFSVSYTKDGKVKYSVTNLLFPNNKSHINKIKKLIGDSEIDENKIYLNTVFEKEV